VGCYGREAGDRNKQLVEGKTVFLEKDVREADQFGRLLRYIYLEEGQMVNDLLVSKGYAQTSSFPPDIKYQDRFIAAQQQARQAGRGLWGSGLCAYARPAGWGAAAVWPTAIVRKLQSGLSHGLHSPRHRPTWTARRFLTGASACCHLTLIGSTAMQTASAARAAGAHDAVIVSP
jgi:hypothetical protein